MTKALFYVIGYLALMVPTYVLPFFGSNSIIANGIGAAMGRGITPFWWLHVWALVMLILMAFARGRHINKTFIMVFPITAGVFDMTPGLSLVPFVPTAMHLVALVLGAMGHVPKNLADGGGAGNGPKPSSNGVAISALLMTLVTILGSLWFALNTTNTLSSNRTKPLVTPQPESPKTSELNQNKPADAEAAPKTTSAQPPRAKPQKVTTKPLSEGASQQPVNQAKPDPQKKSRYINLND